MRQGSRDGWLRGETGAELTASSGTASGSSNAKSVMSASEAISCIALTLRSKLVVQLAHDPQVWITSVLKLLSPRLDVDQSFLLHRSCRRPIIHQSIESPGPCTR